MQVVYETSFFGFSHGWTRFDIPGSSPPKSQWYSFDNDRPFQTCPNFNPKGTTPNMNLNEPSPGGAQIFGNGLSAETSTATPSSPTPPQAPR
jgi:hypothetical protein